MPSFPVIFGDYACMNGFHSSVIFLDAYRKGLTRFDIEKAYEGIKKNSLAATLLPWRNGPATSLDTFYRQNEYMPALHLDEKETVPEVLSFEKRQAVAVTLGASYNDWAAGNGALTTIPENQSWDFMLIRGDKKLTVTLFGSRMRNYVSGKPITIENHQAVVQAVACINKDENFFYLSTEADR